MMSAAWEKEAKAAIGSPKGGRKPLPEAEARALARQQQGATRSEERTPGTSPKSPGRKQPPKPTPPPRSPATPKPPASPKSPESPSRRKEQLQLLRKRFNAIELNVATLRSMGWEAGEEFPDTAHGDMQAMRVHRASLRNMAEWDLYDIGPQYVDDRDAMVASLGRQLDMLDAHADINREERVQGKPIRSRISRKEIIERVDRVRELARQREERQERERENKRQKELRLARQRRQAKEEEERKQAKGTARRTEEERKRRALLGEPKRKRSREAKAPGGSEPSSSDSEEEAPQGPEDVPPASPGKPPSDTPPLQPRPPLFKKPAKLPRTEPSPEEGEVQGSSPVRPWMDALARPGWNQLHPNPEHYLPVDEPAFKRWMFVSPEFHRSMLTKLALGKQELQEQVETFLADRKLLDKALDAVAAHKYKLIHEEDEYQLPTMEQMGMWFEYVKVAPVGKVRKSDHRFKLWKEAVQELRNMFRMPLAVPLVLLGAVQAYLTEQDDEQVVRSAIALLMCMYLNFKKVDESSQSSEIQSRAPVAGYYGSKAIGTPGKYAQAPSKSGTPSRHRDLPGTQRTPERSRSRWEEHRPEPSHSRASRGPREREEGEVDRRTSKVLQELANLKKMFEEQRAQAAQQPQPGQVSGVHLSYKEWCQRHDKDPEEMVDTSGSQNRPKPQQLSGIRGFDENTPWMEYRQRTWNQIFHKAGELHRRTDWACDELHDRLPNAARAWIARGCLTEEDTQAGHEDDPIRLINAFHTMKARKHFLDYMYYVMETREPRARQERISEALRWLNNPATFKARAGLSRTELEEHWNLYLTKVGTAGLAFGMLIRIERGLEVFERYPRLMEVIRWNEHVMPRQKWTEDWPTPEATGHMMEEAERWRSFKHSVQKRILHADPTDLRTEGDSQQLGRRQQQQQQQQQQPQQQQPRKQQQQQQQQPQQQQQQQQAPAGGQRQTPDDDLTQVSRDPVDPSRVRTQLPEPRQAALWDFAQACYLCGANKHKAQFCPNMQTTRGGLHDICTSRAKLRAFLFDQIRPAKERLLLERDAGEIQFDIVQSRYDRKGKRGRGTEGNGGRGAQSSQQGGQAQQQGGRAPQQGGQGQQQGGRGQQQGGRGQQQGTQERQQGGNGRGRGRGGRRGRGQGN
jgi:hypothetical protein